MIVKSKASPKGQKAVKAKDANKTMSKPKLKAKTQKKEVENAKPIAKQGIKTSVIAEAPAKKLAARQSSSGRTTNPIQVTKRIVNPMLERRRPVVKRSARTNQFAFMKAPGLEHAFDVGDTVEVFCDHEKSRERIRGWIRGIVVQVDNKMVAVQFRSNVYLTDGWMVPDRILWYPLTSEHIRTVPGKKSAVKKEIFVPEY